MQSESTYSNSNHTVFGVHAIGLNKSQFGCNMEISGRNSKETMVVESKENVKAGTMKEIL